MEISTGEWRGKRLRSLAKVRDYERKTQGEDAPCATGCYKMEAGCDKEQIALESTGRSAGATRSFPRR